MITYFCDKDAIKHLFALLYKIYKHGKTIMIIVKNEDEEQILNDVLWKFRTFLPHGDKNSIYAKDQPILITDTKLDLKFDIHFYFNCKGEYKSGNILWNPEITSEQAKKIGKVWKEENGAWKLL